MKKNQLALIFLTLITMLAVWYFKSPTAEKTDDPTIIVTNSKNQVLASMREAIRNERSQKIADLNDIIADENATIVSKTAATLEKEQLSTIHVEHKNDAANDIKIKYFLKSVIL